MIWKVEHLAGPTALSVIDPAAIKSLYATSSPCTKGPFYSATQPMASLQFTRDKREHAIRRKDWDRAFNVAGQFWLRFALRGRFSAYNY